MPWLYDSTSVITVAPVVVKPDIVSKKRVGHARGENPI